MADVETHYESNAPQGERVLPPKTIASPADIERRRKIRPTGFSHCGIRSRDLEATRHFYEDVIGLPMVLSESAKQQRNPMIDGPFDLIHIFFELADGSVIGFFGIEKGKLEPHIFPAHPLQMHFAIQIESEQEVHEITDRAKAAGYRTNFVDFGSCFSGFVADPDGIMLELCYHRDNWFADVDMHEARENLDTWVANGERWA